MNKRFHKSALSVTTALLTLTSAVTTVNATQRNQITISGSSTAVESGETFNVAVGYTPDGTGASGFTIDLHYDTDAVSLNIPDEGSYSVDSEFSIVTNFTADDGVVRIVGANLKGENVTSETAIADLSFTVNDGFYGDINFWTTVDTLVAAEGTDFVNVDFTAQGEYDPYTVSCPQETVETVESEETVDDEPSVDDNSESEDESSTVDSESEENADSQEESEVDSQPDEESAEESTVDDETAAEEEIAVASGTLFTHTQGDSDYNNEEALQYTFSPYDYITDVSEPVDISVSVSSDGSAQGGIGMQTSDGWKIYGNEISSGGGETVWTANNVDLSDVSGDIAVQLYYLKNSSKFTINSISITYSSQSETIAAEDETVADTDTVDETVNAETSAEIGEVSESIGDENDTAYAEDVEYGESAEDTDNAADTAETEYSSETYDTYGTEEINVESGSAYEDDTDSDVDENTADTADSQESTADTSDASLDGETTIYAEVETERVEVNGADSRAEVEDTVADASENADSNPVTGSSVGLYICGAVMVLCGAQIIYSAHSLLRKQN